MKTTRGFQTWRRLAGAAQSLLYLALPFVTVGGESALRLDVPGARLHALGFTLRLGEAFPVLAATLAVSGAFLLVTLLYGRVWCGWSCPQTLLSDLTDWLVPLPRKLQPRWRRPAGLIAAAVVSAVFSAATLWYFVPPMEFLGRLADGTLGGVLSASWLVVGLLLFADVVLLRQVFCSTACPYAKLQGVLFDRSTLVIGYDARRDDDCVDCGACVRVCPTGIDIRDGLQMECIACAKCVDACRPIMAKLKRPADLVGYFHGEPGTPPRRLRPATLAVGALTAAALAALVASLAGRALVAISAEATAGFPPRRTPDGHAVNAFDVDLENHGRAAVVVALAATGSPGARIAVRPAEVTLAPGEERRVRLLATAAGLPAGRSRAALLAEVRAGADVVERREVPLSFAVPEAR